MTCTTGCANALWIEVGAESLRRLRRTVDYGLRLKHSQLRRQQDTWNGGVRDNDDEVDGRSVD